MTTGGTTTNPNYNSQRIVPITSGNGRSSVRYVSSSSGGAPPRMPWQHPDAHLPGHHLQQYTIDLTALAAENKLDPVIGREDEIRRCLQILARRTKVSTSSNQYTNHIFHDPAQNVVSDMFLYSE
jgi:ATP-dependent Clp protease ATP-binding subunit ClpA